MARGGGLTESELFWLDEETRLRRRASELEAELRRTLLLLQEAEARYRDPRPPREADALVASGPGDLLGRGRGRGPRCRLCGWATDEAGGSPLLHGACALCRGLHGQEFARPRALLEAVLEEPTQALQAELAAAEAWSAALGRPVGVGERVDAVSHLARDRGRA